MFHQCSWTHMTASMQSAQLQGTCARNDNHAVFVITYARLLSALWKSLTCIVTPIPCCNGTSGNKQFDKLLNCMPCNCALDLRVKGTLLDLACIAGNHLFSAVLGFCRCADPKEQTVSPPVLAQTTVSSSEGTGCLPLFAVAATHAREMIRSPRTFCDGITCVLLRKFSALCARYILH